MDLNKTAFRIVAQLTAENKGDKRVSQARTVAGRVGGPARAAALSPERRKAIAVKANRARWGREDEKTSEKKQTGSHQLLGSNSVLTRRGKS
jgi:hypothetical protein